MDEGLSGSYILISKDKQISYSKHKSEYNSETKDWKEFLNYEPVNVIHGGITINIFFDAALHSCADVMSASNESMQDFFPAPAGDINSINHETNLILVSKKSFEFTFPLSEDKSYFAVGVDNCETLPTKVFNSASLLYHELYHIKSYYSGNYLNMDELEEERRAEIIGICSLVYSDRMSYFKINKASNSELPVESLRDNSSKHSDKTFNASLQGQANVLWEISSYRDKGKSSREYCDENL